MNANAENQMILAVDVGNSNVTLGVFAGERLLHQWRLATVSRRTADEVRIYLRQLFRLEDLRLADVTGIVLASVVPAMTSIYTQALQALSTAEILNVDHATPIALENHYGNPAEVGPDRLANAVAGKLLYGLPVVIVDFGSAITLDVIGSNNAYLGGIILPGIEMTAEAMHQKTARLPQVSFRKPEQLIGVSTEMSINSGLYHGMIGAIDAIVAGIEQATGEKSHVGATGGAGRELAAEARSIQSYEPHLTLIGLREIWRMNKE